MKLHRFAWSKTFVALFNMRCFFFKMCIANCYQLSPRYTNLARACMSMNFLHFKVTKLLSFMQMFCNFILKTLLARLLTVTTKISIYI